MSLSKRNWILRKPTADIKLGERDLCHNIFCELKHSGKYTEQLRLQ